MAALPLQVVQGDSDLRIKNSLSYSFRVDFVFTTAQKRKRPTGR